MTWWGALGLALSLYGVVVLLEWVYDSIVRSHSQALTPISLVVRVTNQEAHIEHALRDLIRVFGQSQWEDRRFEVLLVDRGSQDHTRDIVDRLSIEHLYFRVVDSGSSDTDILALCQYPIVIWVDLTRHSGNPRVLSMLTRFLSGLERA